MDQSLARNPQSSAWKPQPGLQIPELFSGPHSGFFSARVSSHLARNAKSGFLSTLFFEVPGNAKNNVGSAGSTLFLNFLEMRRKSSRKKFRNGAQKKVPESGGLVGGSGPSFGPDLIFKSGQKHQKCPEMGPESTVWAENRSRSMPGPLRSVSDWSCGQKK